MEAPNNQPGYLGYFLRHIEFNDDHGQCWHWRGPLIPNGYGRFAYYDKPSRKHKAISAHRCAFQCFIGSIPSGMQVLHHCDNKACVNPKHLFLGTALDNMRDKVAKGRQCFGSKHGRARLNEIKVSEIKVRLASGETKRAIAALYGVAHSVVGDIRTGKIWRHVA